MKRENNLLDRLLQNRVLTHVLFWLTVWLIAPITSNESITEVGEAFLFRGIGMPTKIVATYLLAYYQIPSLLQKKKYIQFFISFVISSIIFSFIYRINNVHIAERLAGVPYPKESLLQMINEFWYTYLGYFMRVYFYGFIFVFIKIVKVRSAEKHRIEVLEKEKATAELNFLKAQIHPHFLFNTLNNLYALTLEKSDKAPEVVSRLSEMLDYMLYQSKEESVPIRKEVDLLEHYIDLEKLRYGDRLELEFSQSIDDPQASIAPLILLSVVENAFKHGVSGATTKAIINISLEVEKGEIYFKVFNTRPSFTQGDDMNYKEGIGSKNIKRQLELIYPDAYTWKIDEQEETYEVNLWIRG